jgi:hypothetical protein
MPKPPISYCLQLHTLPPYPQFPFQSHLGNLPQLPVRNSWAHLWLMWQFLHSLREESELCVLPNPIPRAWWSTQSTVIPWYVQGVGSRITPTQIAKFKNAQVLYIILCSMHIVLDTLHQLYNTPHTDYSVNAMQTVITLCCLVNNDKTRKSIRAQCSFVLLLWILSILDVKPQSWRTNCTPSVFTT